CKPGEDAAACAKYEAIEAAAAKRCTPTTIDACMHHVELVVRFDFNHDQGDHALAHAMPSLEIACKAGRASACRAKSEMLFELTPTSKFTSLGIDADEKACVDRVPGACCEASYWFGVETSQGSTARKRQPSYGKSPCLQTTKHHWQKGDHLGVTPPADYWVDTSVEYSVTGLFLDTAAARATIDKKVMPKLMTCLEGAADVQTDSLKVDSDYEVRARLDADGTADSNPAIDVQALGDPAGLDSCFNLGGIVFAKPERPHQRLELHVHVVSRARDIKKFAPGPPIRTRPSELSEGDPAKGPSATVNVLASVGSSNVKGADGTIARIRYKFVACLKKAATINPVDGGTVKVVVRLDDKGTVTSASLNSSDASTALTQCVVSKFADLKFEAPDGGSATFIVPIVLKLKEP
ncbi:MAG: hypothetical protein ACHREM_08890, partial [Polyangiales bacterium]